MISSGKTDYLFPCKDLHVHECRVLALLWRELSRTLNFIFHHHHHHHDVWLCGAVFRIWRAETRFRPKLMRVVVSHLSLVSFLFLHCRGQEMTHNAMMLITQTLWQIQYRRNPVILTKGLRSFAKQSKSSLNKLCCNAVRAYLNSIEVELLKNNSTFIRINTIWVELNFSIRYFISKVLTIQQAWLQTKTAPKLC